jgi:membrane-bound serine protease (ClpP class)
LAENFILELIMSLVVRPSFGLLTPLTGGLTLCLLLLACRGAAGGDEDAGERPVIRYERGVVIRFEGMITPLLEHFFYRRLAVAEQIGADLIIIEIESPGGLVDPSFNVAQALRNVDWAHTVAFVPREALSGAAVVALGCDQIFMHPDALMGDVGVMTVGRDSLFRYAEEKIRTHVSTQLRDLAEAQGRPPALAEAMVNMDLVVYYVTNRQTGEQTFMSDDEIAASDAPELWEKGKPVLESREKHFLEVNGRRAVELGLADGNARDLSELVGILGLTEPPRVLRPTGVDTAVFILNLPFVTGLLFLIGLVALYIEFSAPGISIGGLIAVLCFALFFWSRFLGGTAEVLEIVLFLAGVMFLAVEVFVLPGFGISGLTGLLLIGAGLVMASQDFVIPQTPRQLESLSVSMLVLASSGAAFLVAASILHRYFGALPIFNRLILAPVPAGRPQDAVLLDAQGKPVPGVQCLVSVGDWGVTLTPLRPAGKARFGEEMLDVLTDGTYVDAGRTVRIDSMQGPRIQVSEVEDA